MTQALSINDLHSFGDEPRVQDLKLAEALGFEKLYNIRKLIERNREELETHGLIFSTVEKIKNDDETNPRGAGRQGTQYHLNEAQALLVCMFSRTAKAAEVRKLLVDLFIAWRSGQLEAPTHETTQRVLLPGHPDFGEAVRLVREARLTRGKDSALALWRSIGLPWVPEMESDTVLKSEADIDSVALFAREGMEAAPGIMTPAAMIVPAYAQFCAARNLPAYTQASFQTRFGKMGFSKRKIGGRHIYLNIRVRSEQQINESS